MWQATKTELGKTELTMALFYFTANILSRSGQNTVRAFAYRAGSQLVDSQTAKIFNYKNKDVQHVELLLPKNAHLCVGTIQKVMVTDRQKSVQDLCDIVESAETRINSQVLREFEFALHRELSYEQNMALVRELSEIRFAHEVWWLSSTFMSILRRKRALKNLTVT